MNKLLDRDSFRNNCLKRDNYECVICNSTVNKHIKAVDVHHIMERRLFTSPAQFGGYFESNGITLCTQHHIEAEQTLISPQQFYDILGVKRILPDDLYDEFEYSKWADIILANGTRLKGPLFYDESVQKILASGNVLNLYSDRVKHHRTFHCHWSESKTEDDRTLLNADHFKDKEIIQMLKMDGEQSHIYWDGYFHARSIDAPPHHTQSYVRNLAAKVGFELPKGWRISCENLYAKHSIKYTDLEDYVYLFAIWNEINICLDWNTVEEWAALLNLKLCPVIYRGIFNEQKIKENFEPYKGKHEGYIIRLASSYPYGAAKYSINKFVRKNHVQTSNHWKYEKIERNELK